MTAMGWFVTADTGEFLDVAGEYLRAEPARNSVMLTVTEDLRVKAAAPSPAAGSPAAAAGPGLDGPWFGWWRPPAAPDAKDPAPVGAACMHTPGFPVLLSQVSVQAAAELARDLATAGRHLPGVNAAAQAADAFAAAWRDGTGNAVAVYRQMRLFRLPPADPARTGTRRISPAGHQTGLRPADRVVRRLRSRRRRPAPAV